MATLSPTCNNVPRERHSSPQYDKPDRNTNISHYKNYNSKNTYDSHTHRAPRIYRCKNCNKHFTDRTLYAQHKSIHRPLLHCPICPTSFRYVHWLDEHVRITHKITPRKNADVRNYKRLPNSKILMCKCGNEYNTLLLYNNHKTQCNYREPLASNHNGKQDHHCSIS